MKTGVLVLLVAFLAVAQSKSVPEKDLLEKLLERLTEKRAEAPEVEKLLENLTEKSQESPEAKGLLGKPKEKRLSIPPDSIINSFDRDTKIMCYMYKAGERVWMPDPCYDCRYNRQCNLSCHRLADGQGQCIMSMRKKCKLDGQMYPIGEYVQIQGLMDACPHKFTENCEVAIEPCQGPFYKK